MFGPAEDEDDADDGTIAPAEWNPYDHGLDASYRLDELDNYYADDCDLPGFEYGDEIGVDDDDIGSEVEDAPPANEDTEIDDDNGFYGHDVDAVPSPPTRSPVTLASLFPVVREAAWSREELEEIVGALARTDDWSFR